MSALKRHALPVLTAAAVIMAAAIAHNVSVSGHSLVLNSLLNNLHAPGFAILTFAAIFSISANDRTPRLILLLTTALVVLAAILEASQVFAARDADVRDLLTDITGILFAATSYYSLSARPRVALAAAAVLLGALTIYPAAAATNGFLQQRSLFPVLADFEARWQTLMTSRTPEGQIRLVTPPPSLTSFGDTTAMVSMEAKGVPGLDLRALGDWRGFEFLSFDLVSASEREFDVSLRVHDTHHNHELDDRFDTRLRVLLEPQDVSIPLDVLRQTPSGRVLDLAEIEAMIFFVSSPVGGERMYIDNVRLR